MVKGLSSEAGKNGGLLMLSRLIVAMTIRMPRWFVRWVSSLRCRIKLQDAVRVMKRLESEGACFTIDVLGEEISSLDEAQFFLDEYVRVMNAIVENKFDANLSIKPTAFGLLIDKEKGMENIESLVSQAAVHDMFVRLDMEDHRVTSETIQVVIDLHEKGLTNVGNSSPRSIAQNSRRHPRCSLTSWPEC